MNTTKATLVIGADQAGTGLKLRRALATTLIGSLLTLASCSKDEGKQSAAAPKAPQTTLEQYVPSDAVFVSALSTESEAYERWRGSTLWKSMTDAQTQSVTALNKDAMARAGIDPQAAQAIQQVSREYLVKLLGDGKQRAQTVQSVTYAALPATGQQAPQFGSFAKGNSQADMRALLTSLKATLDANKVASTVSDQGDRRQLSISSPNQPSEIWLVATTSLLGIGSSKAIAESIFNPAPATSVLTTPEYQEAKRLVLDQTKDAAGWMYVKPDAIAKASKDIANTMAQSGAGQTTPPAWIMGTFAGGESLEASFSVPRQKGSDWPAAKSAQLWQDEATMPTSGIITVALDGATLHSLSSAVTAQSPGAPSAVPCAANLNTATIALAKAGGASMFPELAIRLNAPQSATCASELKTLIGAMGAQAGLSPWNKKNVGSVSIDYAMSPFGVGAFLASTDGQVILTSSEGMMNLLLTQKGSSSSPPAALANSAIGGRIRFRNLYEFLEQFQGTMAMFQGGQSGMDMNQFSSLREMGEMLFGITALPETVRATVVFVER